MVIKKLGTGHQKRDDGAGGDEGVMTIEIGAVRKRRRGRPTVNTYSCQIADCGHKFSNQVS